MSRSTVLVVACLLLFSSVPILAADPGPDAIDEAFLTAIDLVQDTIDAQTGALVQDQDVGPGKLRITIRLSADDYDADGRKDYAWYRIATVHPTNAATIISTCGAIQLDYIYDGEGRTTSLDLQDAAGAPAKDPSARVTVMQYNRQHTLPPKINTADSNKFCPIDPAAITNQRPEVTLKGAHVEVINNGPAAAEETPTSLRIYDADDLSNQIDVFSRSMTAPINPGPHLVVRSFTLGSKGAVVDDKQGGTIDANGNPVDTPLTIDLFPLALDFTNVHLVAGTTIPRLGNQHDLDDDGAPDLDELRGSGAGASNPLNSTSVPADLDGDGYSNHNDAYPTDPDRFRAFVHDVHLTSPAPTGIPTHEAWVSGPVQVAWTVSSGSGEPIDHFDLIAVRVDVNPFTEYTIASNLPASDRSYTWNLADTAALVPDGAQLRMRIDTTDAGADPITASNQTAKFKVTATKSPTVSAVTVSDFNGQVDEATTYSGSIRVVFQVTPARPTASSLSYSATLYSCPVSATDHGTAVATLTGTAVSGSNEVVFLEDAGFAGKVCTPPSGSARVRVTVTETENTISKSGGAGADFKIFNNRLPTLTVATAKQMDATERGTALNPHTLGNDALFSVNYADPDERCNNAPNSVKLFINDAATSQPATGSPFVMTIAPQASVATVCVTDFQKATPNYAVATLFQKQVSGLTAGKTYTWHVEAIDDHDNKHDGTVNPPVSLPGLPYTHAPGTASVVDDKFNEVFECAPGSTKDACVTAFTQKKAQDLVKAIEDAGECDIPQAGYTDKWPTPCSEKPGDTITGAIETVQDEVAKATEDILKLVNELNGEGLPNAYPLVNCDAIAGLLADTHDPGEGCNTANDEDRDGYSDAQEQGFSDPYNPYSQPGDVDADLIPDTAEVFVDVNLIKVEWINTAADDPADWHPCGADDVQSDCNGKLSAIPSPDKRVTVYPALGLNKASRLPYLLEVRELATGGVRVSSQLGCSELGGQDALECGFSWTLPSGLFSGPTISGCNLAATPPDVSACRFTLTINAEDDEPLATVVVDMTALQTQGEFVKVTFGGGRRLNAHTVSVTTSPLGLNVDGRMQDNVYDAGTRATAGTVDPVPPCSSASPQAASATGSWIRTERTEDNRWRICGQARSGANVQTFWQETPPNFQPVVGAFLQGTAPVVWMDRDNDYAYDAGEELTSTCRVGEAVDDCVSRVIVTTLGCNETATPDGCVVSVAATALGCQTGETLEACANRLGGSRLGCQTGEALAACVNRQVSAALGCTPGEALDVCAGRRVVTALGCDAGMDANKCIAFKAGCTTGEDLQTCANRKGRDQVSALPLAGGSCAGIETPQACLQRKVTATANNIDNDTATNSEELNASPRSNPFYKHSTPTNKGLGFPSDWDADQFANDYELKAQPATNPFQRCSNPNDGPRGWSTTNPRVSCEDTNPVGGVNA